MVRQATPERTVDQRMEALERANEVRSARAKFKIEIKHAPCLISRAYNQIESPDEEFLTMKLFDLIVAMPKYGLVKAMRVLNSCRISPSKTLGGLTDRQREEVVEKLRGW